MKEGVVVVTPHHGSDWIVPRRVMCAFFWVGIVLLFTGIILLVTSKHKEEFYQSWGAILLGLGFCLLLICFILCLHAYCVITVSDDEVPNARRHPQTQTTLGPISVRQRAPLKKPPEFKVPSSETESTRSSVESRLNFHPTRLKTINENGSPGLNSRHDKQPAAHCASVVRADHIRTAASRITSLPPSGKHTTSSWDTRNVHYSACPSSVTISLGNDSPSNDTESGYQNSTGTPKNDNASASLSLVEEEELEKNALSSRSSSSLQSIDVDLSSTRDHRVPDSVPMPIIREKSTKQAVANPSNASQTLPESSCANPEQRIPDSCDHRRSLSLSSHREPSLVNDIGRESARSMPAVDTPKSPERRGSGKYACVAGVDEEAISPEYRTPPPRSAVGRRSEELALSPRPVVSTRVSQLPSNRQPKLPNGAPLQLTYSRQYPISSVHAYPTRLRKNNPYTPLRVQVDSPDDEGAPQPQRGATGFRPMPAISELQSADHSSRGATDPWQETEDALRRPPNHEIIRPFERTPSNLLGIQSIALNDRGLNNSANVYLSADQEFSESKMSIYDNLNYIRI